MQLNKDIQRTDLPKKDKSNTDLSITHYIPILSSTPSPFENDAAEPQEQSVNCPALKRKDRRPYPAGKGRQKSAHRTTDHSLLADVLGLDLQDYGKEI